MNDDCELSAAELGAQADALYDVSKRLAAGAATIGAFARNSTSAVFLAAEMIKCLADERNVERVEAANRISQ